MSIIFLLSGFIDFVSPFPNFLSILAFSSDATIYQHYASTNPCAPPHTFHITALKICYNCMAWVKWARNALGLGSMVAAQRTGSSKWYHTLRLNKRTILFCQIQLSIILRKATSKTTWTSSKQTLRLKTSQPQVCFISLDNLFQVIFMVKQFYHEGVGNKW